MARSAPARYGEGYQVSCLTRLASSSGSSRVSQAGMRPASYSRGTEFVLGIAVARLVVAGRALPRFLVGPAGVALGLGVMLMGRFLMTDLALRSSVHVIVYAANVPLLVLGYSLILWSVVSSDSLPPASCGKRLCRGLAVFHTASISGIGSRDCGSVVP